MWLLLPVPTPVMVIADALALQRFERLVLAPNPVVLLDSDPAGNQYTSEVRGDGKPRPGGRIERPAHRPAFDDHVS